MIYLVSFLVAILILSIPLFTLLKHERWFNWYWYAIILSTLVVLQSAYTGPMYNVWQKQLVGKAELAQAEWNRQIVVEEAKAKEESAKSWANAEVTRAKGSDEANEIMARSLGGNENYLRWLWIEKMDKLNGQVIYLPSDGGIPIMEAAKRK